MDTQVIVTDGLTKKFKQIQAVDNVSFKVNRGELFGLVGPDGAGKSTIIKMLCSILKPTAGRASISGLDTIKESAKIRGKIGYMSEGFSLYGTLTIDENIEFFADLYQVPADQRAKRKRELLHFSRLTSFVDRPAEKLSGGMKKKLALCCTLIYSPEILLLDEPTLGVDPVSRREFWKILHDFRQEGITIVVSTPYMDEAERCDRLALLHQGKIIKYNTPVNLRQELKGEMIDLKASPQKKAFALLKNMEGMLERQVFGERIHLQVDEPEKIREKIIAEFAANEIELEDFRKGIPTLEDVFVSAIQESQVEEKNQVREITYSDSDAGQGRQGDQDDPPPNNKGKDAVIINRLTKKFGSFTAVNSLDLTVKQGEIFGFLGPNGSGKSTVIKMLAGLLVPTSGRAAVDGLDIIKEQKQLKQRIGYMSQKFSLYDDLTVDENINLFGGIYGVAKKKLQERKRWVLNMAGLAGKESSMTKSLSGGWKQRLALGCAILHEPSILFLDEPTAGVDPIARRYFWDLIFELAEEGVTVFVTTHYMDEAEHCHNLGFIYDGNLIAAGSPLNLKNEKIKGQLLEIECNDPIGAVKALKGAEHDFQASPFGNKVRVIAGELGETSNKLEAILKQHGFQVKGIEQVPISLEDLFVLLIEEADGRLNKKVV